MLYSYNGILFILKKEKELLQEKYNSVTINIKDKINSLDHSLLLIKPKEFEVVERRYDDNEYPQQRLLFKFNEINYDLPITDPVFLRKFQADPSFVQDIEQIYVSMSVGVIHNDWYNKLVAGIISAD